MAVRLGEGQSGRHCSVGSWYATTPSAHTGVDCGSSFTRQPRFPEHAYSPGSIAARMRKLTRGFRRLVPGVLG